VAIATMAMTSRMSFGALSFIGSSDEAPPDSTAAQTAAFYGSEPRRLDALPILLAHPLNTDPRRHLRARCRPTSSRWRSKSRRLEVPRLARNRALDYLANPNVHRLTDDVRYPLTQVLGARANAQPCAVEGAAACTAD
jgi:hypothetical protein